MFLSDLASLYYLCFFHHCWVRRQDDVTSASFRAISLRRSPWSWSDMQCDPTVIRCIWQSLWRWSLSIRCWSSRLPKHLPRKRWNSSAWRDSSTSSLGSATPKDSMTLIRKSNLPWMYTWVLHITRRRRIGACCSTIIMMCYTIGNVSFSHCVIEANL